ncbi:MAG: MBL fold metallo-hydrolase [Acetobacteraceae bacterium]|nr:MBL fold metallo-hydrolase [Acetobacteraceae bacterium]
MSAILEVTVLGSGSSGGVPRADGEWGACDPAEPRNRRSRCSMLARRIERKGGDPGEATTVIIDTAPELRQQCAAAGVKRVDGVLITHDHADQTNGLDDLRAFFLRNRFRTPCYMNEQTRETLDRRFGYIFVDQPWYPAICEARDVPDFGRAWAVDGPSGPIPITAFDQDHGSVRSVGYRLGPVAYSSDVVAIPEESFAALDGVRLWIVDALRYREHPTHANVEQALRWIERVQPERAVLTNLHMDLDYRTLAASLPQNVEPAYDGLRLELELVD